MHDGVIYGLALSRVSVRSAVLTGKTKKYVTAVAPSSTPSGLYCTLSLYVEINVCTRTRSALFSSEAAFLTGMSIGFDRGADGGLQGVQAVGVNFTGG